MQIQNLFNKEDRAVSPVIGVILMVAITVILAAVIGTFVLGLGSNVQQNAQAGVTFQQSGDASAGSGEVTITANSIQRAESFSVKVVSDNTVTYSTFDGSTSYTSGDSMTGVTVGDTMTVGTLDTDDKITVIASYDGNSNVIGEYTVK